MAGYKEEATPFTISGGKRLPKTAIQASFHVWWQEQLEFLSEDWFALCGEGRSAVEDEGDRAGSYIRQESLRG